MRRSARPSGEAACPLPDDLVVPRAGATARCHAGLLDRSLGTLLGMLAWGLLTLGAGSGALGQEQVSPRTLPQRSLLCGDLELPHGSPPRGPGMPGPLSELAELVRSGQFAQARESLRTLLEGLDGNLLLPEPLVPEIPLRLPPPAELLAPVLALANDPYALIAPGDPCLESVEWPSSPAFWAPAARPLAWDAFLTALESGALGEARRWAAAPVLRDDLPAALRSFVADVPPAHQGPPDGEPHRCYPQDWTLVVAHALEEPTPARDNPARGPRVVQPGDHEMQRGVRPTGKLPAPVDLGLAQQLAAGTRRMPLPAPQPVVTQDLALLELGTRLVAFTLDGAPSPRWVLSPAPESSPRSAAPPVPELPGLPAAELGAATLLDLPPPAPILLSSERLLSLARTETPGTAWPLIEFAYRAQVAGRRVPGWFTARLVELTPDALGATHLPADDPLATALARLDHEGSWCAVPLAVDGLLVAALASGIGRVSMEIVALELATGSVRWRRWLGRAHQRRIPDASARGLAREARLLAAGPHLVVIHDAGWLSRLDLPSGALTGLMAYPRHEVPALPYRESGFHPPRYPAVHTYPAWRGRLPGIDSIHGSLLVCLPPDAQHLQVLDLERWQPLWADLPPAAPCVQLLGCAGGHAVLLDLAIPPGAGAVRRIEIDLLSGAAQSAPLVLDLPAAALGAEDGFAPLLTGTPTLLGETIGIPTVAGLELHPRAGGAGRLVPWPPGCPGGSPTLLATGHVLVVTRGDEGLGTAATLSILGAR